MNPIWLINHPSNSLFLMGIKILSKLASAHIINRIIQIICQTILRI